MATLLVQDPNYSSTVAQMVEGTGSVVLVMTEELLNSHPDCILVLDHDHTYDLPMPDSTDVTDLPGDPFAIVVRPLGENGAVHYGMHRVSSREPGQFSKATMPAHYLTQTIKNLVSACSARGI